MASIPRFCSDYRFSPEEFSEIMSMMALQDYNATFSDTISSGAVSYDSMLRDDSLQMPYRESDVPSPISGISFPERLGISEMTSAPTLMEYNVGLNNGFGKIQNFVGGLQSSETSEYAEDYCGLLSNFRPAGPSTGENWGMERETPATEHSSIRVGRYTVEERKYRILRYLKKRNQRNFNKTIKYACRKTLADRRVRVRGRFARNNEIYDEETGVKENNNYLHEDKESHHMDPIEIKNGDDEWLQEAMASIMCLPYVSG